MSYKDKEITKLFYSIGEVAKLFDVNTSLIRFWEKEFDVIQPRKNKKGNRQFTPKDVANFKLIYTLVKEQGHTLEGAKKALKRGSADLQKSIDIKNSLEKIKKELQSIEQTL
jgi:DNA-binding transcriptional MerR regulator